MERWAVFDIDGTLLPHRSMESMFVRHALKSKQIRLRLLALYILKAAISGLAGNLSRTIRTNKSYFGQCHAATLERLAAEFFKTDIEIHFPDSARKRVAELRNSGFKILILSGTPDILARNLLSLFKVDHMICTRLEIKNDRFTGKILGDHPYGPGKRKILIENADRLRIDFSESQAFANHETDVFHMELFGKATAVNPTRKLRRIAESCGWETVEW